jgi:SAM-dependent methyltransferase
VTKNFRPDQDIVLYQDIVGNYANKQNIERILVNFDTDPSHGLCRPGHRYDFISKCDCWDYCFFDIPLQPFSIPRNFDAEYSGAPPAIRSKRQMRDPAGRIAFEDSHVLRYLNQPAGQDHFLRSPLARRWVKRGVLIPYTWVDNSTIRSPKLPFVTLPPEWTASQFSAAAKLTLELQSEAVIEGWDLKDASAWNVVFIGLQPIFVDLLSFVPLREKLWQAAGQFSRHFILPLLLDQKGYMEPRQCLQLWRDGVPPDVARRWLGMRRFLTPYWPLMVKDRAKDQSSTIKIVRQNSVADKAIQSFRASLQSVLGWMLNGVSPEKRKGAPTIWVDYEQERSHYTDTAIVFKRAVIGAWLEKLKPEWVLDVGCNAGEFSELAVGTGSRVICWDSDPQALLRLHSRQSKKISRSNYFPVLCSIDDASGGRGWMGSEFPSLMSRLHQRVDVVMLLAVTHHLAIADGVRLEDIFRCAAYVSRRAVLLELISETDERVLKLCQHFNRSPVEFSLEKQYEALAAAGFKCVEHAKQNPEESREYLWLERKDICSTF